MATMIDSKNLDNYVEETFILDTNVWLYLFSNYNIKDFGYSKVYEFLLENECKILFPPIVGTEFINRYCRQSFETYKSEFGNSKSYKHDFRSSAAYKLAFSFITGILKSDILSVVQFAEIEESNFNNAITSPCLADLNDDIIMNIAIKTNSILITHDRDYRQAKSTLKLLQL